MRFKVKWPDGQVDRVEVNDGASVTYAEGRCRGHIFGAWCVVRGLLTARGAEVKGLEDGELWDE